MITEIVTIILCYFAGGWFLHLLWWRNQKAPKEGYVKTLFKAWLSPIWHMFILIGHAFKRVSEFFLEIFK